MVKEAEKYLQLMDRQYYKSYGKVVKVVGLTIESVGPKFDHDASGSAKETGSLRN